MNSIITNYEYARIIGERAEQLARGSTPQCDFKGMTDPIKIAQKEYELGTIPITIIRTFPNGVVVNVDLKEKSSRSRTSSSISSGSSSN